MVHKLLLVFFITLFSVKGWGQNTIDNSKRYQIGLMTSMTINWVKPQTIQLEREGIGVGFHGGIAFKYFFLDKQNIGISTGLFFDAESFTLDYAPSSAENSVYYNYNDKEILQFSDDQTNSKTALLLSRTYKPLYITLPLALQFQTHLIGYFKYFGRVGLNTSFLVNTKVNDRVAKINPDNTIGSEVSLQKMNTKNELEFIKTGLVFGGGMNWFFSGNIALHAELNYNFGFTNLFKGESRSIVNSDASTFSEKMTQDQFVIKVGILF